MFGAGMASVYGVALPRRLGGRHARHVCLLAFRAILVILVILVVLVRVRFEARVEHLREMEHARGVAGAGEPAAKLHQAARIARDERIGARRFERTHLFISHGGRDVGHLDGEGAAEAAAERVVLPLDQLQPTDVAQQRAGLLEETQLAALVAAGVEDGFAGIGCAEVGGAQHVDEKVGKLAHTAGDRRGAAGVVRVAAEDKGVVVGDHGGAGAGGADDVVAALTREDVEEVTGDGARVLEEAGVEGGLATAGLTFGVDDLDAQPAQYAHGADADLWGEQVHVAGDEEGDAHGETSKEPPRLAQEAMRRDTTPAAPLWRMGRGGVKVGSSQGETTAACTVAQTNRQVLSRWLARYTYGSRHAPTAIHRPGE